MRIPNIRADFLCFTSKSVHICPNLPARRSLKLVGGKLAEGSDKSGPMIGFWAQGWDKKHFLRLGPLLEREFQGKKPKSVVHLLLEK